MNKYNEHDPSSDNEGQNESSKNENLDHEDDDIHFSRDEQFEVNRDEEVKIGQQRSLEQQEDLEDNIGFNDDVESDFYQSSEQGSELDDRQVSQHSESKLANENIRDSLQPPAQKSQRKQKGNRWLTPVLLGIVIGILLTTVALPAVIKSGLIPSALINNDGSPVKKPSQSQEPAGENYISVDVTTQITDVVAEVSPAVVGVTNIQQQADFWRQQSENEAGTGSGVIYKVDDDNAFVITNHHVVEQADVVEVVLSDETTVEAELLGSDIFTDLAVLRIDSSDVDKVIERGSSDEIKVGEPAIAIGNPLGHMFSGSVTQGVISGTQRTIPLDLNQDGRADWQAEVIQTDAAVNPGNSGGALINIDGKLIGINSMKINQNAVEGMAFAIPIDSAWPIIEELETTGEVTRAHMGVEIYSLDEVPKAEWSRTLDLPNDVEGGVYVWSVERLSPADRAGLERLDVITELDGNEILGTIDLRKVLYQDKEIGDEIDITYYRDGKKHETTLTLGTQQ